MEKINYIGMAQLIGNVPKDLMMQLKWIAVGFVCVLGYVLGDAMHEIIALLPVPASLVPIFFRGSMCTCDYGGGPGHGDACSNSSGGDSGSGSCSSCSSCASSSSSSSCASCSSSESCSSTPFLYVRKGQTFSMENDVMFGKPRSRFNDLQEGLRAYHAGQVTSDLYLVQSKVELDEDGKIKLQIREIEPEVSAIFDIELSRVSVPAGKVVYTTSDFKGCILANKNDVFHTRSREYVVTHADSDVTSRLRFRDSRENDSVTLETGDQLNISFKATDVGATYLLLESWYRDWTLGEVYSEELAPGFTVSPYTSAVRTVARYTRRGVLAGVVALIAGYIGFGGGQKTGNAGDIIANHFGTKTASADHTSCASCASCSSCRSLEVAYRNTAAPQRYEVVEPRYARPSTVAVKVPEEALHNGVVNLRITATKRHKVSAIAIVSAETIPDEAYEVMPVEGIYHHREKREYAESLRRSDTFVKTYPSDILTLTFGAGTEAASETAEQKYLLRVGGVYAPATKEDQRIVGDWVGKLDDEALEFLSTVYKEARRS